MSFASDTFSGSAGTELSAYSASWAKQSGYTQNGLIGNDGQYAYHAGTGGYAVYQHSGAPASADYSVFASLFRKAGTPAATGPQMGVCGRMQAGAGTFYAVLYEHGNTRFSLYRFNATTPTLLGTRWTHTLTTTPETVELRMSSSDISVYVDGVLRIGPVTDSSPISTAGKAGIILFDMRQTGVNDTGGLDNFDAVDAAILSDLSGNVTLDAVAPAGTLADAGPTALTGNVTLDVVAPAGSLGLQPGVVTVPALRNWSGSLQTSVTIPVVTVLSMTTGAQVLALTDQVTDGTTADLTITDVALVPGTAYMVAGWSADGSQRFAVPITAA